MSAVNFVSPDGFAPLRIARHKARCNVLGPGTRAVVWFHGCSLDCPRCIAYEMNRSTAWLEFTPGELVGLLQRIPGIEGVTLTGGEPFEQPKESLLGFLQLLRAETPLSVLCYTGRTLEQLSAAPDAALNRAILERCDLVIDGPYEERQNSGQLWRGSANQKVHFFTARYRQLRDHLLTAQGRAIEIEVSAENRLSIAGIPQPGFVPRLRQQLDAQGVAWTFAGQSGGEVQGEPR